MTEKNNQKRPTSCQSRQSKTRPAPLNAWRTVSPRFFDTELVVAARDSLRAIAMIDEPTWRAAADGDAVAAVGLALRLVPGKSSSTAYQLIMTALVACAAEGNTAACVVMAFILQKRVEVTPLHQRLSASWALRAVEIRSQQRPDGAA